MSTAGHSDIVPVGSGSGKEQDFHYKFTVQKGFFQQSEDETDDKEFDFVCSLIPLKFTHSLLLSLDIPAKKNPVSERRVSGRRGTKANHLFVCLLGNRKLRISD